MNLKKLEMYLRVNLLGPGPRLIKKRIYRAAVSQRLRNTGVDHIRLSFRPFATYHHDHILSRFKRFIT